MLALSSLPFSLCLSHSSLRTAPTSARARPAVAILSELPPGAHGPGESEDRPSTILRVHWTQW